MSSMRYFYVENERLIHYFQVMHLVMTARARTNFHIINNYFECDLMFAERRW